MLETPTKERTGVLSITYLPRLNILRFSQALRRKFGLSSGDHIKFLISKPLKLVRITKARADEANTRQIRISDQTLYVSCGQLFNKMGVKRKPSKYKPLEINNLYIEFSVLEK